MINILLILNIFFVDIKGEVINPGVYSFKSANIMDIILKAGGITKNGDTSRINLSKTVVDEMVIYIPHRSARRNNPICNCPIQERECPPLTTTTRKVTTTTLPPYTRTTLPITTTTAINEKININVASLSELTMLQGIGPAIARRIIEYREHSLFLVIEDVMNVSGIGEAIFAQIKDFITV
jgi:competence protein ComEA